MLKMAIISGASHALKYKKQNSSSTDEEVLQQVNREANEILAKLDSIN